MGIRRSSSFNYVIKSHVHKCHFCLPLFGQLAPSNAIKQASIDRPSE